VETKNLMQTSAKFCEVFPLKFTSFSSTNLFLRYLSVVQLRGTSGGCMGCSLVKSIFYLYGVIKRIV